ncbi:LEAF RUST 10 DISEASE-RESISTANCE LOCUS RECEPTOR-LIKE PROTEIN KINASE-like 1.2 isoform X1 [Eucalyptus grandis]|uniref:LEAF RUST 10 DISEASE-RESISTANCE LOCUS RECEPTOR-LIKE PROTEIN KINASE-like 1.2 isoform X1 n=1 Tax=Eucalyptus grandis TaxID=71139 RepID=UPI00192EC305|nr:LEAF RUST 10 DISEASE-RESISTANCE LOCUS RECEPTOR-LIKE PROTEIN KINASE-like 1.2 isoform X1 [Eucalyptus grandis]
MGLHCTHTRGLDCIAFCIFFIFILEEPVASAADKVSYEVCTPHHCGGNHRVSISYPFFIPGGGRDLCGYPGFEVSCEGTKTMYGHYSVKSISYEENSVDLAIQGDISCFASCPFTFPPINIFLNKSLFLHPNLWFFINCTSSSSFPFPTSPVKCTSNATYNTSVALLSNGTFPRQNGSCGSISGVPVQLEGGLLNRTIKNVTYKELLKKGFRLKWDLLTKKSCTGCEKSGGRCGRSQNTDFLCYCPHGTDHPKDCKKGGGKRPWWKIGLGASVIGIGSLAIILLSCMIHLKKKNASLKFRLRNSTSYPQSNSDMEESSVHFEVSIFNSTELEEATNNFAASNELGDGGFGTVYYGKIRDGREVAVKRLHERNYRRVKQFMNEVEILTRLQHKNLVSLYGCTSRHSRELLLVYEYISNGTVADHIHGQRANSSTTLPWQIRMGIAIETATALAYLHASDIVHRDVKTNNILLDKNFGVKVGDFGLSRLFRNDVSHISTAPQGTPGYVDPEYHRCYQLTEKSDIYSFGVVLIELVSSKPAVDLSRERDEINLADFAINKIQNCAFGELIDPNLGFESDSEINRMTTSVAELAFLCLQQDKEMRPPMDEVLEELKAIACNENAADIFAYVDEGEGVLAPSPSHYDDSQLLKNMQLTHSPVSVTQKWGSSGSSAPVVDG